MKVVAFNGSPRLEGNTAYLLGLVLRELEAADIETELVHLFASPPRGCTACYRCFESKDKRCAISGDCVNDCVAKMIEADGILCGSPTFFANVSAEMKALLDRAGLVARANGNFLRRKVGAAVVAVRRGGAVSAFDAINHMFLIQEMIVVGSVYWNFGIGRQPGEVEKDEEGLETMRVLGRNMAWLLKKVCT